MNSFLMVAGAGFVAGGMNALAGGGSFVSLPAMIAAGVPPVQANASSTVALFPGGAVSAFAYRDGLGPVGSVGLKPLLLITIAGGVVGALLLLWTPSRMFNLVLPWLLLLAAIALGFGRQFGEWLRARWRIRPWAVLTIQFGLGVYGGYFGGAVGIMMMAAWGLLDGRDIKSMNAPRTLMVTGANAMAVLIFIAAQAVALPQTAVMLVAASFGGYAGARLGRVLPAGVVRLGTLLVTTAITLAFFARAYL